MVSSWAGTAAQMKCTMPLADVVKCDGVPTLADVSRVYGNVTALSLVSEHIRSVFRYAGIDMNLEDAKMRSMVAETALAIVSGYYYLNLYELCIFFNQLKTGQRGQFVWGSRINNQAVMVALHDFASDRREAIVRMENERYKERSERGYSRIDDAASAMVSGVKGIRNLAEKAKTDYKAFRTLFPLLPNNYKPEDLFGAYGGKEAAIRAVYGDDSPPGDVASRDIYKFLCDYNCRYQELKKRAESGDEEAQRLLKRPV